MQLPAESKQPRYPIIAAGILAIIVFGSLFPFDFYANPNPAGPFSALIATYGAPGSRGDLVANILLYAPLGFFSVLALSSRPRLKHVLLVVLVGWIVSTTIELTQFYDRGRVSSMSDVYSNVAGTVVGAIAGVVLHNKLRLRNTVNTRQHPFVVVLLACWLGFRLFPYVPTIDLHKYWHAVKPLLFDPQMPLSALYRHTVDWLAVALLIDALTGVKRSRWILSLSIPALLFSRILIIDITLSPAEVAGGVIAALLWFALLSRVRSGAVLITLMFVGSVIVQGLEPFHFNATARAFGWIPFRSFLSGSVSTNVTSFFEKTFTYGALTWLLVRSGCSLRAATLLGGSLVLCLRLVQVYLPGRSAEITDVLMLLILAAMMKLMSEDPSVVSRRQ